MPFKVMSRECDQYLMKPEARIVSARRAGQIISECKAQDVPFLCHKGTIAGQDIACRGLHDATGGCRNSRMADWLGLPHEEIDPDTLKRTVDGRVVSR